MEGERQEKVGVEKGRRRAKRSYSIFRNDSSVAKGPGTGKYRVRWEKEE